VNIFCEFCYFCREPCGSTGFELCNFGLVLVQQITVLNSWFWWSFANTSRLLYSIKCWALSTNSKTSLLWYELCHQCHRISSSWTL